MRSLLVLEYLIREHRFSAEEKKVNISIDQKKKKKPVTLFPNV